MPDRGSALARRSHSAPRVVSPRNKVNIALPLSMIRVEEPAKMKAGDWIALLDWWSQSSDSPLRWTKLIRITHTPRAG